MIGILKKYWPLILLLSLTLVLRLAKLEELFYFSYDESIPAFVGRRLILWQHIPLIGGVTPFNVHLGPYFYWFLTIPLFIGNLNPLSWGLTGALIAVLTTLMMYLVGTSLANKRVGFTAAGLWTFSYLANVYDRHLWALYWGPLLSLVVIYSLLRIKQGKEWFIFILSAAVAFGIHADPSNVVFLFFAIFAWILYKLPVRKTTFAAITIFFLSFLPLIIFDLRHNFANTKPFLNFINQDKNRPGFDSQNFVNNLLVFPTAFTRLIYTFGDNELAKQYSYCQAFVQEKSEIVPQNLVLLSALTLLVFIILSFSKKPKYKRWRLVSILIALYFLGIQLYGTIFRADIFEHYISGVFALFLLIASFFLAQLPKKIWLVLFALFVAVNLAKLFSSENSVGLKYKREAIEFTTREVGDKPFSLESVSTCWKYSGYRYLFAIFGKEPIKSYVDPNLAYLYGTTPLAEEHPETVVVFVTHDFIPETESFYTQYARLKSHEIRNELFGNIEVIIMNNASGWFDSQ